MADWNLPLLTSVYSTFLALLKARDEDAITLGKNAITNPVLGTVRFDRPTNVFQEWDGSNWIPLIIGLGSGGIGANTAAGGRTTLGIGTMGTQNANSVSITGGNISGLGALGVNGNVDIGGTLELGSANNVISNAAGLILATKLSGIVPPANLGSGTPTTLTFLRGDGTWANAGMYKHQQSIKNTLGLNAPGAYDTSISGFTNVSKMFFIHAGYPLRTSGAGTNDFGGYYWFPNASTLRFEVDFFVGNPKTHTVAGMVFEII